MRTLCVRSLLFAATIALAAVSAWADKVEPTPTPEPDPPSVCDAIVGNLVSNCGFESGSFGPWTLSGNTSETFVEPAVGSYQPNSGTYFALLGAIGSDDIMTQDIATTAGQSYDFTFYLASDGRTTNDFSAIFGGDTVFSQTNIAASGYVEESYLVTASSDSTVIEFDSRDDPGYLSLDDISVVAATTAAPEPRLEGIILALLFLTGVAFIRRRRSTKAAGTR